VAELGALDDFEFLSPRELIGEHRAEIAAGAAIPPAGGRIVAKLRDTDRWLAGSQAYGRDKK